MKVSVVIPNYNYAVFLEETIASVYAQTHTAIECIVVNDGSTDNSILVLEELKGNRFPELVIIDKENGGLSQARNSGIKKATGEVIAFLDADDKWKPEKIANQLAVMKSNNAEIVYSDYLVYDGQNTQSHDEVITVPLRVHDFIGRNPVIGSASSVIMTKKAVDKVGFFDPNLRSLEDIDYWFRCIVMGFQFVFCNTKDVYLRTHNQSSMGSNHMRMLAFHLIVLDKQLQLMRQHNLFPDHSKEFKNAFGQRMLKVQWYALQMNKHDYSLLTVLMGIKYTGFGYLFKMATFKRFIKDLLGLTRIAK